MAVLEDTLEVSLDPGGALDPATAAAIIADWGFLAEPGLSGNGDPACLLAAIRAHPTLRHYDPESIGYWITDGDHGSPMTLDRGTHLPLETDFSWGTIRLVDRLRVSNEYLTFGGHLSAAAVDDATVAVFMSPAPLLRRGGHSQGWDLGAQNLGAFFGRLRAAVGYSRRFEAQAAAADPLTRYAAFILDFITRYQGNDALRRSDPRAWALLEAERRRLSVGHLTEWAAGGELLAAAGYSSYSSTQRPTL